MIQIEIAPDADLIASLVGPDEDAAATEMWHGRDIPAVAVPRLTAYVAEVERLAAERWGEVEIRTTSEDVRCGPTGRTERIIDGEASQEELREIGQQAWQTALEAGA